jgi:hypothetical protein
VPLAGRVTLITELPAARLATGVRRRLEHHLAALAAAGIGTTHVALAEEPAATLRTSVSRARKMRLVDLVPRGNEAIVIGLGDVASMVVADSLARAGYDTTYDQCDSMVLQLGAAVRDARLKDVVWAVFRIIVRRWIRRTIVLTYISGRDLRWDRPVNVARRVDLVQANVDPKLLELGDMAGGGIDRVSVPADFHSPHLRKGLAMLWTATAGRTPVPLDLFGPAAPAESLPVGASYRGFASDIGDVYVGRTAVFIANIGGAGVPNKLLEAALAKRPVIVHPSVKRRVDVQVTGWTFRTSSDIRRILAAIASGSLPRAL